MIEPYESLSAAGEARREAILRLAVATAARRRTRRRVLASAAATLAIGALVIGLGLLLRNPPSTVAPMIAVTRVPTTALAFSVGRIETDSTITDRLSVRPASTNWNWIN